MTRGASGDEEAARIAHQVTSRAVRRLDAMEWGLLAVAAFLASIGGALIALLLAGPLGVGFRTLWVVASVLMFAVPGALALMKMRREERALREKVLTESVGSHG